MSSSLDGFKVIGVRNPRPYAAGEREGRSWDAGVSYKVILKGSDGAVLTVKASEAAHKAAAAMPLGEDVVCDFDLQEFSGQLRGTLIGFRKAR